MGFGVASKLSRLLVSSWLKKDEVKLTVTESDDAVENIEHGEANQIQSIDWNDLNYPWGLNIVHYSANELDDVSAKVSRISHIGTFVVYGTLLLNLVDVIILARQLLFNICYVGNKEEALPNFLHGNAYTTGKLNETFSITDFQCLLYLALAILGEGPINGFTKFAHLKSEIAGCAG
ncbi:hypothetical protein BBBOND_0400340 [Babesia bigemina]|uniref:Uncharacterized protein n=1 Tax=Babesia bigemina TaxID=5866 RepID=A0A061DC16_BABBI|nr:hypothetical protein BBBOND_0400340 [Babesia bigemina]CDR97542.1 hypothetical protein BBBOND_0400340 [Babesia bigemina]|eukprot:XP_012769728.1 hypothetical protein BBBOND_0400340 [Babesia bigemina]